MKVIRLGIQTVCIMATLALIGFGSQAISSAAPDYKESAPASEAPEGPVDIIDAVTESPSDRDGASVCSHAGEPVGFPVFSAGSQVAGWDLTHIMRYCAPTPEGGEIHPDYVSYLYGSCVVQPNPVTGYQDGGCPLPIQVQTWPSCARNRHGLTEIGPIEKTTKLAGGAVMYGREGFHRAEILTGTSTVVVYAGDGAKLNLVVESLRRENPDSATEKVANKAPAETLPAPAEGAIDGGLNCD